MYKKLFKVSYGLYCDEPCYYACENLIELESIVGDNFTSIEYVGKVYVVDNNK